MHSSNVHVHHMHLVLQTQAALMPMQVQNLVKHYFVKNTVFKAVQDATLDFPANKIIALLGPSGSGKTTLLRLIAGLESVTDGQIFFGGT